MNMFNQIILITSTISVAISLLSLGIAVKTRNDFRRLTKITGKENLDEILVELLNYLKSSKQEQEKIKQKLNELMSKSELHLQKVGMVRFNPFAETGGEQSFSLALLDGQLNGFVISSLHNRDQTRMYVRAIAKGGGDGIELSKEEQRALRQALKEK